MVHNDSIVVTWWVRGWLIISFTHHDCLTMRLVVPNTKKTHEHRTGLYGCEHGDSDADECYFCRTSPHAMTQSGWWPHTHQQSPITPFQGFRVWYRCYPFLNLSHSVNLAMKLGKTTDDCLVGQIDLIVVKPTIKHCLSKHTISSRLTPQLVWWTMNNDQTLLGIWLLYILCAARADMHHLILPVMHISCMACE